MPKHCREAAAHRKPTGPRTAEHADGDPSLGDVDDHDAEREPPSLGPQGIGAPCIAAALGADIDAAQPPEQQGAVQRTEQVSAEQAQQCG